MKIRTIISLLMAIQPLFLFAQKYDLNWSHERHLPYTDFAGPQLICSEEKGTYHYVHVRKDTWTVLTYNLENKLLSEKDYKMKTGQSPLNLIELFTTTTGTFIIAGRYDNKAKTTDIYRYEIRDGGLSEPKKIYTALYEDNPEGKYKKRPNMDFGLSVALSEDKKKIVLYHSLSNMDKKNTEEALAITMFNENLEKKWSKVERFPMKDTEIDFYNLYVSNKGEIVISGRTIETHQKYRLRAFLITESDRKEIKLKLGQNEQAACLSVLFHDGKMLLAGIYQKSELVSAKPEGVFLARYRGDEMMELEKTRFDDVRFFPINKDKSKPYFRNSKLRVSDFTRLKNGDFEFVAEGFQKSKAAQAFDRNDYGIVIERPNGMFVSHDDLYIVRLSPEGTMQHFSQLFRAMYFSMEREYKKHLHVPSGDNSFLFYYDYLSKEEKSDLKGFNPFVPAGMLAVFDQKGIPVQQQTLFHAKESGYSYPIINIAHVENKIIFGGHNLANLHGPLKVYSKNEVFRFGIIALE